MFPVESVLQSSTTINSAPGILETTCPYHSRTQPSIISDSFQAGITTDTIFLSNAASSSLVRSRGARPLAIHFRWIIQGELRVTPCQSVHQFHALHETVILVGNLVLPGPKSAAAENSVLLEARQD